MRLFGKKKKEEDEGIPVKPSSKDFDIDDIDLPPLPDLEDESSKELEFSKGMEKGEDLPPLPEPPKPHYPSALPKKQEFPMPPPTAPPVTKPVEPEQDLIPPAVEKPAYHPPPSKPSKPVQEGEKAPVFVKIDKYREVLEIIDSLKTDLKELGKSLDSLKRSKKKEDEIVTGWNGLLSEVSSKLDKIDSGLFEPEE